MKLNCDRFSDWLKERRKRRQLAKLERISQMEQWHDHFVLYKKLGHGDCRILETIQRRLVRKYWWAYYGKSKVNEDTEENVRTMAKLGYRTGEYFNYKYRAKPPAPGVIEPDFGM